MGRAPGRLAGIGLLAAGVTVAVPLVLAGPGPASAAGGGPCGGAATLTLTGSGVASGAPDQLVVTLTVDASGSSAQAALAADNSSTAAVVGAFRSGGVPGKAVQTTGLSLQPDYTTKDGDMVLTGYSVDNTVTATIAKLSSAGAVVDAVATAGGNNTRLQSLTFGMADPRHLQDRARHDAVTQAASHAGAMAKAAGDRLGGVCSITDVANQVPSPLVQGGFAAAAPAGLSAKVPLEPGTQKTTAQVRVVYRLLPGRAGRH